MAFKHYILINIVQYVQPVLLVPQRSPIYREQFLIAHLFIFRTLTVVPVRRLHFHIVLRNELLSRRFPWDYVTEHVHQLNLLHLAFLYEFLQVFDAVLLFGVRELLVPIVATV